MSHWKEEIDLSIEFALLRDLDEENFDEDFFKDFKEKVFDKMSKSEILNQNEKFVDTLLELKESDNPDEFNYSWAIIYDIADESRVWIKTI